MNDYEVELSPESYLTIAIEKTGDALTKVAYEELGQETNDDITEAVINLIFAYREVYGNDDGIMETIEKTYEQYKLLHHPGVVGHA